MKNTPERLYSNFLFPFLILIASIIRFLNASRTDQVGSGVEVEGGGIEGSWGKNILYCPENSFVNGYRQKIDRSNLSASDPTALNVIEMSCIDYAGEAIAVLTSQGTFDYGTWFSYGYCPTNNEFINFASSYQMIIGPIEYGALGMRLKCISRETVEAPGTFSLVKGVDTGWGNCEAGSAICGFQSKDEEFQGSFPEEDDSTLNHIRVYCCRLCDLKSGFYLEGNKCKFCHYSCKTCSSGEMTNCKSCYEFPKHKNVFKPGAGGGTCEPPACTVTF
jgi:hypothetical protein